MKSSFLRFAVYTLAIGVAVTLGAALFAYSISRQEVRVAQQMMEDVSRLQIGKSALNDALAFAHKYNGEATGSWHENPCLESDCLVTASPDRHDFWERHPKLGYAADRISRRGWHFLVLMWVKDGKLTGIEQWFTYSTPQSNSWITTSVSRPTVVLCRNEFYRLHPTFAAYPGPKDFKVWVDPSATEEKEMLRLNIACVTKISGCKGVTDMAPAAWRKYEADQPLVDANRTKRQDEIAADSECR